MIIGSKPRFEGVFRPMLWSESCIGIWNPWAEQGNEAHLLSPRNTFLLHPEDSHIILYFVPPNGADSEHRWIHPLLGLLTLSGKWTLIVRGRIILLLYHSSLDSPSWADLCLVGTLTSYTTKQDTFDFISRILFVEVTLGRRLMLWTLRNHWIFGGLGKYSVGKVLKVFAT